MYSLFQSDRKNSDGDSEIQDPLKEAVKIIMGDTAIQQKLDEVASLMGIAPDWLSDINLRVDGYECFFYQKD